MILSNKSIARKDIWRCAIEREVPDKYIWYLRTVVKENGSINEEITHRASAKWEIRRSIMERSLCDRKMPVG